VLILYPNLILQIKPILDFKCYCGEFYEESYSEELYKSTENLQLLNVSEFWTGFGKACGGKGECQSRTL